jgi:DNA replication protein DnaC
MHASGTHGSAVRGATQACPGTGRTRDVGSTELRLASLAFLERKENVLLLGPPGVGKTHLGIALGTEAIVAGSSVYFVTMQDLAQQFSRARDENKLKERMSLLIKPKLLILDQMGYLTLDSFGATCLFQLVSERYEKGSGSFSVEWTNALHSGSFQTGANATCG